MANLKEWMDAQWQAKGVKCANHGTAWLGDDVHSIHARAGTQRSYIDKETKRRRAKLAMYNEKLRPIILAEATSELRNMVIPPKSWREDETIEKRPHYTWPKQALAQPEQSDAAPAQQEQMDAIAAAVVAPVPRKRVSKAKLDRAAAILEQVPADELAGFLARFGLSMSLAASIASLDNIEMISRQFLRATL